MQGHQSDLEALFAEELGLEASAVSSTLTEEEDGTIKIDFTVTGTADELDSMDDADFLTNLDERISAADSDLAEALGFIDSTGNLNIFTN